MLLYDIVHRLCQGNLCVQNAIWFYSTYVNEVLFMPIRKWWPSPCANFHYTLKYLTLFCTYLFYWTSPKIRQWISKLWIEIYFHFYVKHGFHCANCYEGCKYSVNLCGCLLYLGLFKLDDKCRTYHHLSSVIKYLINFHKIQYRSSLQEVVQQAWVL